MGYNGYTLGRVLAQISLRGPEGGRLNAVLDSRSEGNLSLFRPQSASVTHFCSFRSSGLTYSLALCFRDVLSPFLFLPMVVGLRLALWMRPLEYGMPILPDCSVLCMVMAELCPLISAVSGTISQSEIGMDK